MNVRTLIIELWHMPPDGEVYAVIGSRERKIFTVNTRAENGEEGELGYDERADDVILGAT